MNDVTHAAIVGAILLWLADHGVGGVTVPTVKAVIEAADRVLAALEAQAADESKVSDGSEA